MNCLILKIIINPITWNTVISECKNMLIFMLYQSIIDIF